MYLLGEAPSYWLHPGPALPAVRRSPWNSESVFGKESNNKRNSKNKAKRKTQNTPTFKLDLVGRFRCCAGSGSREIPVLACRDPWNIPAPCCSFWSLTGGSVSCESSVRFPLLLRESQACPSPYHPLQFCLRSLEPGQLALRAGPARP